MGIRSAAVLLIGLNVAHIACAMDNEPDGFRGTKWGDKPGDSVVFFNEPIINVDQEAFRRYLGRANVFGWDYSDKPKEVEFPELRDVAVRDWLQSNLKFYFGIGGKTTFADAPITSPMYAFYKDQFLGVTMTLNTTIDLNLAATSDYHNEQKINDGLKKFFGLPDRQKLSFFDQLNYGGKKPTYQGEKMQIWWSCRASNPQSHSTSTQCKLTFQSVEFSEKLRSELKDFQAQMASRRNATIENRERAQAAKPDY